MVRVLPFHHHGPGHLPAHRSVRWQRRANKLPNLARLLFLIIMLSGLAGLWRAVSVNHDQYLKMDPTDFSALHSANHTLPEPQRPLRLKMASTIDHRYYFQKQLGEGLEGSAALYNDTVSGDVVVVKSFKTAGRNLVPAQLASEFDDFTTTWPSELEAGLYLANYPGESSPYVPVIDYFILRDKQEWAWAIVSPFISEGTLLNLAARVQPYHTTPNKLDETYRRSLLGILQALLSLHQVGICHDDVKPDNIFVRDSTQWLLADMGNVRHFQHSWHGTSLWRRQNQWADCELNDVRRSLKTYLTFLRDATEDTVEFDQAFWSRKTSWSRLYWEFMKHPRNARDTIELSRDLDPADGMEACDGKVCREAAEELAIWTERELLCTTIPIRLWKWWWFIPGTTGW